MATEGFPLSNDVLIDGKSTAERRTQAGPSLRGFGEGDVMTVMTDDEVVHSFQKVDGEETMTGGWWYNGEPVELSLYVRDRTGAEFRIPRTRLENGIVLGVRHLEREAKEANTVHHLGVIAAATAVKPATEHADTSYVVAA